MYSEKAAALRVALLIALLVLLLVPVHATRWHEEIFREQPRQRQRRHFVELGAAAGGLGISNTLALERDGWHGLCIEPSLAYAQLVKSNRTCIKRGDAVSGRSGDIVDFLDQVLADPNSKVITAPPSAEGLYSGIAASMSTHRVAGAMTKKVTRTLAEILDESRFPNHIDFLSLDTEGSELDILSAFPFENRSFGAVLVKHNHEALRRRDLRVLLESKGYVRVRCIESDDLYVSLELLSDNHIRADPRQCHTITFRVRCQRRYNTVEGRDACRTGQDGGMFMRQYPHPTVEPWLQPHLDRMTDKRNIGGLCATMMSVCDRNGWVDKASGMDKSYRIPAPCDLDAPSLKLKLDSKLVVHRFAKSLSNANATADIGVPSLCLEHSISADNCLKLSRWVETFVDSWLEEYTTKEVARVHAAMALESKTIAPNIAASTASGKRKRSTHDHYLSDLSTVRVPFYVYEDPEITMDGFQNVSPRVRSFASAAAAAFFCFVYVLFILTDSHRFLF